MRTPQLNSILSILVLVTASLVGFSCRSPKPPPPPLLNRPEVKPINSIRIGNFQCKDPVIAEAVKNVFIEILTRAADVRIVREGDADVVIEGTITVASGESASIRLSGGGKGQSAGGDYVSGVTSLVTRNGEVLTSASWGQDFGKGDRIVSPESVARRSADYLLRELLRAGLKRADPR